MENNKIFKSFDYVVRNLFIYEDQVEVKVFFIYREFHSMNKSLFIKKIKNKDEAYYLEEAKKIIDKMINDGSLEKECDKKIKRKKILPILIPISAMVVAGITVGCIFGLNGNGGATPIVYHTIKFSDNSLNCKMYDVVEPYGEVTSKEWEAGEIARYKIKGNYACSLPSEDQITFTTDDGKAFDGLHSYDASTGELSVKMTANVTITAKADYYWYLDNDNFLSKLTEEDVIKDNGDGTIGVIKTLKVNGVDHKVRLIGVDQDSTDEAGEDKIHTTWEFATLLSDNEGHSLALQYDDMENDITDANYLISTIRKALNGTGDANHFLWAQKGDTTWTQDPLYKDKTVLDMLDDGNPGLLDVLKSPYKTVNINTSGSEWVEQPIVNDEGKFDKLFLLSNYENAYDSSISERIYKYYSSDAKNRRIKKQFKENEPFPVSECPKIGSEEGQMCKNDIINYAGLNIVDSSPVGRQYWLRSPAAGSPTYHGAHAIQSDGSAAFDAGARVVLAIAPAFCI